MKDVIVTVVCVIVLGGIGYFGPYLILGHQDEAKIAAMPQPDTATVNALKAAAAKNPDDQSAQDKLKEAEKKNDPLGQAITDQQAADAHARSTDSIIGGVVGVVIGIGVGILLANMLNKKPGARPA